LIRQCHGHPLNATQQNLNDQKNQHIPLKNSIVLGHVSNNHYVFVESRYEHPRVFVPQKSFIARRNVALLDIEKDVTKKHLEDVNDEELLEYLESKQREDPNLYNFPSYQVKWGETIKHINEMLKIEGNEEAMKKQEIVDKAKIELNNFIDKNRNNIIRDNEGNVITMTKSKRKGANMRTYKKLSNSVKRAEENLEKYTQAVNAVDEKAVAEQLLLHKQGVTYMQYKQSDLSWRVIVNPSGLRNGIFKNKFSIRVEESWVKKILTDDGLIG
jgi:hypothetical protein